MSWAISGKICRQKEYQKGLQPLLQTPKESAHLNITSRLGTNGLSSAVKGKNVSLNVIILDYLTELFDSDLQNNTNNTI